jgi:serralysin
VIIGNAGKDVMTGGGGVNQYLFIAAEESRADRPDAITDFTHDDMIEFAYIDGDTARQGYQKLHFGETRRHTGDVTLSYDEGSNITSVNIFTDSDAAPDMVINLLGQHTNLTADNFTIV